MEIMAAAPQRVVETASEDTDNVQNRLSHDVNKPTPSTTPATTMPSSTSKCFTLGTDSTDTDLTCQINRHIGEQVATDPPKQVSPNHETQPIASGDKLDGCKSKGAGPEKSPSTSLKRGDPIPGRCQHYLPRKRRYCRTIPQVGKSICVEHSFETTEKKRIQCPLDPKHTCYETQLKGHLKKCNARMEAQPVYYVENLNAGQIEDGEGAKVVVSTVEPEEIKAMVETVKALYKEHVGTLRTEILGHAVIQEEIDQLSNGPATQKHLKQQASLVGHIDKQGLLHDGSCYIEFGAGKAGLSHWVQKALASSDNTKFVLVDKSSVRYKMDSFHRGEHQGPNFDRLRIDIQHLDLNQVPSLLDNQRPLVGLGKHLCGGATDLMLRCLMQTVNDTSKSSQRNPYVEGLVLALCCHHRCDWRSYVGKDVMKRWGIGSRQFSLMASMTSWATCATRTFLKKLKERELETGSTESHQEEDAHADPDQSYNHPRYGSMAPDDREDVGFKCKKLLDQARFLYLQEHGFTGELLLYADLTHTLENVVLVARNSKQPEELVIGAAVEEKPLCTS